MRQTKWPKYNLKNSIDRLTACEANTRKAESDIDDWEESSMYDDVPPIYCKPKLPTEKRSDRIVQWICKRSGGFIASVFHQGIHKRRDDR